MGLSYGPELSLSFSLAGKSQEALSTLWRRRRERERGKRAASAHRRRRRREKGRKQGRDDSYEISPMRAANRLFYIYKRAKREREFVDVGKFN